MLDSDEELPDFIEAVKEVRWIGAVLDDFKRHIEAQDQAKRSGTPGVR